jgi:hypothetical protein
MWLTGAPLQEPKPGAFNTVSLDQTVALHTKRFCRQPSLVLSIDAGVGFMSRTATLSYDPEGEPIPAENDPRRVFERLFSAGAGDRDGRRAGLRRRMSLVDAVLGEARSFTAGLGHTDRETMDNYLTGLCAMEERLEAAERWLDVPLAAPDRATLDLDATTDGDPARYYRTMFDLIALAFAADTTRSVTFMLSREDGMGISDTFPLKLGLGAPPTTYPTPVIATACWRSRSTTASSPSNWRSSSAGWRRSTSTARASSTTRWSCTAAGAARPTGRAICRRWSPAAAGSGSRTVAACTAVSSG